MMIEFPLSHDLTFADLIFSLKSPLKAILGKEMGSL
jgi:hypothetical protein